MRAEKRGVLFVEFLFVFVISLLMIIYFFLLSMTFIQIEVAQYIAFKTAREYFLGNENQNDQRSAAGSKFVALKEGSALSAPLFFEAPNWWELEVLDFGDSFGTDSEDRGLFEGVRLQFTSKVIHASIPYIGGSGGEEEFIITSYLGREPTEEDCGNFFRGKAARIQSWFNTHPLISTSSSFPTQSAGDNGC